MSVRSCVGCGKRGTKEDLLRLVAGSDGELIADPAQRLPGRAGYVCYEANCILGAVKKGRLDRTLRRPVRLPDPGTLCQGLASRLEEEAVTLLAQANRAGKVYGPRGAAEFRRLGPGGLAIIAWDVGEVRKEMLERVCHGAGLDYIFFGSKAALGIVSGVAERSIVVLSGRSFKARVQLVAERCSGVRAGV